MELKDIVPLLPVWSVWVLLGLVLLTAVLGIYRAMMGHPVKIFGFEFGSENRPVALPDAAPVDHSEREACARSLQEAIDQLSAESKTKHNVIRALHELIHELYPLVDANRQRTDPTIKHFVNTALVCVAAAVSKGADDHHRAAVWEHDGDSADFKMYEALRFKHESVANARLSANSIVGAVFRTGAPYNCANVGADPNFQTLPQATTPYLSYLAVPVKTLGGAVIGVLGIDAEAEGYFDAAHVFFVSAIAEVIGMVMR